MPDLTKAKTTVGIRTDVRSLHKLLETLCRDPLMPAPVPLAEESIRELVQVIGDVLVLSHYITLAERDAIIRRAFAPYQVIG